MSYQPPAEPPGGTPPPPPPGEGYTPPPPPPPPPPGGTYTPPPAAPAGGLDIGSLFQSYINALTKPNVATYEAEIPRANASATLLGVAVVAVVSAIMALISAGAGAMMGPLADQFRSQGIPVTGFVAAQGVGGAIVALIGTFITFFLGTLIQYGLAKIFGGQGRDFMTQAYLSSLSYTPTHVISTIIVIVPIVGWIIALLLGLYQIYSVGLSLQASQNMTAGKAQLSVWLPVIVGFVLLCLCLVLSILGLVAIFSGGQR